MRKTLNEPDFYWKNWRLGTELQISGTFIYNALYYLDTLEYLHHEEDIFELLYNFCWNRATAKNHDCAFRT